MSKQVATAATLPHNLWIRFPQDAAAVLVNGVRVPISGETIIPCKLNNPNCRVCSGERRPKTRECYERHRTITGESFCRRCRKPTEYQARWCYDCERVMFG